MRFVNDILLSAPSIVLGLFVYTLVVAQMGHFSALAGGIALAFIVLPVVVRTTDEMLQLVPAQMREAALSLGVPQWKVTMQVLYRSALPGIVTGILLALARISGETAPLLFTALNNQYWTTDILSPMANVPVVIFQYAMSPYESWHTLAWAGAFMLTVFVLCISLLARAHRPAQQDLPMTDLLHPHPFARTPAMNDARITVATPERSSATLRRPRRSSSPRAGSTSTTTSSRRSRASTWRSRRSA